MSCMWLSYQDAHGMSHDALYSNLSVHVLGCRIFRRYAAYNPTFFCGKPIGTLTVTDKVLPLPTLLSQQRI